VIYRPALRPLALSLALTLLPLTARAFDPANGDFTRANSTDIRVLTYNVVNRFINVSSRDAEFQRIFTAIDPDIVSFQEMTPSLTTAEIEARLESYFPADTWNVFLGVSSYGIRNVLASRYPLSMTTQNSTPPVSYRGLTSGLVDLPDATYGTTDFYVMAVHLKSGGGTGPSGDHAERQAEADAIINWMRDARTAGENIDLPANTPMLVVGDMNLGYLDQGDEIPYHATRTLRTGDIFDNGTYGLDSPPDWDGTDSADAAPYDHTNADPHTDPSSTPESRLDRFVYTDSVLHPVNRFVLNTLTLSSAALASAGLQLNDTNGAGGGSGASDHLPSVVDFALGPDPNPPGQVLINEFSYDDPGADDHSFVELINVGGQEVDLQAPFDYRLLVSTNSLPTSPPGAENEDRDLDLQGIIPPGGLFVVYNSTADSSVVAATIQANLPVLQGQDITGGFPTGFGLPNGSDAALALVTSEPITNSSTQLDDTEVEAYLYEDTDTAAGATHYFRTNSTNNLLIALQSAQESPTTVATDTQTYSRNQGDATVNSYAAWTIPDAATPGLPNATAVPVELSVFSAD
jgi:endonuclease/exonuclease/phosphatase family metal-dependent hydrolase